MGARCTNRNISLHPVQQEALAEIAKLNGLVDGSEVVQFVLHKYARKFPASRKLRECADFYRAKCLAKGKKIN